MQSVEAVVQRISRFLSVAEHLSLFIPWVEMMRTQSLGVMDGLLGKLAPAVENRLPVWVEQQEPGVPLKEIPPDEVVEGVETLRRQKRLAEGYPEMVMDMTFVYLCAAYDAYFQDYLVSFILACPQCLRSKRQLTYEQVLDHLETGTLLQYLAEREAHELAYKSFEDQIKFLGGRGVVLPADVVDIPLIQELMGIRNLIMHNDGVVNNRFLD
jgi:hypothetical protein